MLYIAKQFTLYSRNHKKTNHIRQRQITRKLKTVYINAHKCLHNVYIKPLKLQAICLALPIHPVSSAFINAILVFCAI